MSDPAPQPSSTGRPDAPRILLVFAKAPVAGEVKTRLAAGVGDHAAAEIYRVMGRRIVEAVRNGAWRTVVCYAPPGALTEVREWLGEDHEYWAQRSGDLGARMDQALRAALAQAPRACVVGTDAPDLDAARVGEAFEALDGADVVFGPADDGGYYLLALRAPARPELFRRMPWGTSEVLARSRERAELLGLSVAMLDPLRDVDTMSDLAEYPDLLPARDGA